MGATIESKPLTFTLLTLHKTFPNLAKGIADGEIKDIDEDFFNRLSGSEEIRVQNAGTFNAVKLYWNVLLFADEIYPTFSKIRRAKLLSTNSISKALRFQFVAQKRYRELADTKAIERVSFRIRFASSDRLQQIEESVQSIREKLLKKRKAKFDKVVQEVQVKVVQEVQEVKSEGATIKTKTPQSTALVFGAAVKSVPSVEGGKSSYQIRKQKKQEKEERLNKFYRLLCKLARPADGEPIYRRYGRTLRYFNVYKGQLLYSITELHLKYNATYHKNENIIKASTIESMLFNLAGYSNTDGKRSPKKPCAKMTLDMCKNDFNKAAKMTLKVRIVSIRSIGYLITLQELANKEVWENAQDPNNTQEVCKNDFSQYAKMTLDMCKNSSLINIYNKYISKKEEIFAELSEVDKKHYSKLFEIYPNIVDKFKNPYTCSKSEYKGILDRLQKEKGLNDNEVKAAFKAALQRINDSRLSDADFTLKGRLKQELDLKLKEYKQ